MLRRLRTWLLVGSIGLGLVGPRPGLAQGGRPAPPIPEPSYALVVTSAKRVHDDLTFEFKAPKLRAKEWVVYVARLPELSGQTEVRSTLLPGGRTGRDLSVMDRPLLLARVPAQGAKWRDSLLVRVRYEAILLERRLERREVGTSRSALVGPIASKERRFALAGGRQFDFESEVFQGWLDGHKLRRGTGEAEVDFARRAFLEIKKEFQYVDGGQRDRVASHVCQAGKSDSGGLAIVFASVLRANKIPARVLSGRWALPSGPGGNASDEPHVKNDFFAEGVGWVPADIGSAVLLDKSGDGLEYFGVEKGDFLTLHLDTDIEFDTVYFGRKTVEWLQSPSFWVNGTGTFDGLTAPVLSEIRVETLDPSGPPGKPVGKPATPPTARPDPLSSAEGRGRGRQVVTVSGIVMDRSDAWVMVKADGDEDAATYVVDPGSSKRLLLDLQGIFSVARVRLVYQPDGDTRHLISIKTQVPRASGTVTGEVLQNHEWWVEVKPKNAPTEGYAVHFPFDKNEEMMEKLKGLKRGDVVTITFTTDSERHRIETLRKRKTGEK